MEKFVIEGNHKSPAIKFDLLAGTLEIKGQSVLEDTSEFYKPLIEAVEIYAAVARPKTTVNVNLEYFNTSSQKLLLNIFRQLEIIHRNGSIVTINWNYLWDDEDMLEAGENYQAIINVPFTMIKITE